MTCQQTTLVWVVAPPKAEPPEVDDPGYEEGRVGDEEEEQEEWFMPHQENTEHHSSHLHRTNADYLGSHSVNHARDDMLILALKSIVNLQDQPSKPPMGKMPVFLDSYRTFPRFRKDLEVFLGDFYAWASE